LGYQGEMNREMILANRAIGIPAWWLSLSSFAGFKITANQCSLLPLHGMNHSVVGGILNSHHVQ